MKTRTVVLLPILFFATLLSSTTRAGPADYVFVPAVSYGEREIDFKYGVASNGDAPREQAASLGFGYGATEWWFTEFYLKYEREGTTRFDAFEWENKFQLTETGRYPVDVGFIAEFEVPRDRAEGYEFQFGPLFQAEIGRVQLNANVLLKNVFRAEEENGTTMGYQWQVRYPSPIAIDFGAQGFGEMGRWNHWDPTAEQNHRLGPAVFGKLHLGGRQAIVYNAALLFGLTKAAPDHTFRLQVEYEF